MSFIKAALRVLYYTCWSVIYPFNKLYDYMQTDLLDLSNTKRIVLIDPVGGSGKTTLAEAISKRYGHTHLRSDNYKYGDNWVRFNTATYVTNFTTAIERSPKYVSDSTYTDLKQHMQKEIIDELIADADVVIWFDLPKRTVLWRKGFRSFKRFIGVAPQGVAPEKWSNVKAMLKKADKTHYSRRAAIESMWDTERFRFGSDTRFYQGRYFDLL